LRRPFCEDVGGNLWKAVDLTGKCDELRGFDFKCFTSVLNDRRLENLNSMIKSKWQWIDSMDRWFYGWLFSTAIPLEGAI
jgi:hypothetical protein